MSTKEKIDHLLVEYFEIDVNKIQSEARLNEDFGFDSLDAVDMLVVLEENFGKRMDDGRLIKAETLGDVYQIVDDILKKNELSA